MPYKPKTPEIIDLDEYPESPQSVKKKKLDILKERGLEVTAIPNNWTPPVPVVPSPMLLNPAVQHQIMTQAQLFQMYNILPNYSNGVQPPKVIQGKSIFGTSGPEKTVYGNPKDPFMPPPHILQGTPIKPTRNITTAAGPTPQDILDLTCKNSTVVSPQKPAVEIVKVPTVPSPTKPAPAQNLTKNYTLVDGKAVVGSNLEITLVSPKNQTPSKNRAPQKRSSNGKFMSTKTPTPPKDAYPKTYNTPSPSTNSQKDRKSNIIVPNYQINSTRDDPSPTGSTGSSNSQSSTLMQNSFLQNVYKGQNNLAQLIEMQKTAVPTLPFIDPMYMSAIYSSLAGQMDQRQLAMYRDLMASQLRSYPGLLNMGAVSNTPTTKN